MLVKVTDETKLILENVIKETIADYAIGQINLTSRAAQDMIAKDLSSTLILMLEFLEKKDE